MASSSSDLAAALIARSKALVNNDLKKICKEEGQVQSGNKAQLQSRVIAIINDAVARHDTETLNRLRHRVHNHGEAPPPSSMTPSTPVFPNHSSPNMTGGYMQNGFGGHSQHYSAFQQARPAGGSRAIFKQSPFFEVRDLLLNSIILEASPSHRQTTTRSLTIPTDLGARMRVDPTLKLLLFSAMENSLSEYNNLQDVAFPSQIEVKINGDEVKANFKGLKNKPGSTRPADITEYVRKTPAHYRNTIQITYALTQKGSRKEKYNLYIYLVKKHSVEDLARQIKQHNVFTAQSVRNEMRKKANDPDIEVGSVNMSLKDPISTLRMTIPCRSTVCNHNQCFDAESFLQLQEQAPTWTCPVCNKTVSFQGLAVDQYVQDILDKVPKGTDQVTIEPNGNWTHGNSEQTTRTNGYSAHGYDDDSDEDLVEISDYRLTAIKSEAAPTPLSLSRTPPYSSREPSSAPRTGSKRASEVIDLTLSDDDEPPRPAKKVSYNTPSSLPDPSRRYQVPAFGSSSTPMRSQPPSHSSMSSSIRLDMRPTHENHDNRHSYGSYRPPLPPSRPSYPGQGTSSYPTYLGSSP